MDISVQEFSEKRSRGEACILLDVRRPNELALARIEPCVNIPVQELSMRLGELEEHRDMEIVCMCHHGMRSAHAAGILRNAGFSKVLNLTGGIDAYAKKVDAGVGIYG